MTSPSQQAASSRVLSSSLTFIYKFVFPALWIPGFGAGTLIAWLEPGKVGGDFPVLPMTVGWILGTALLLWAGRSLKVVWLAGDWLWVSNFRRWTPIPLRDVESVGEIRWLNIHPILLDLRRRTELGSRIIFMPRGPGIPFASHPLVKELESRIREASLDDPGAGRVT